MSYSKSEIKVQRWRLFSSFLGKPCQSNPKSDEIQVQLLRLLSNENKATLPTRNHVSQTRNPMRSKYSSWDCLAMKIKQLSQQETMSVKLHVSQTRNPMRSKYSSWDCLAMKIKQLSQQDTMSYSKFNEIQVIYCNVDWKKDAGLETVCLFRKKNNVKLKIWFVSESEVPREKKLDTFFLLEWVTPILENPGNRWKNPEFRENPEDSHHWSGGPHGRNATYGTCIVQMFVPRATNA
jgi:hypothetical protein